MVMTSNEPFKGSLELHYHPYLMGKGVTEETAQFFGVGYCKSGTMRGRIVFPLHNPRGILVGYIGRAVDPKAKAKWFHLKKFVCPAWELFNLHRVKDNFRVGYLHSNPFQVLTAKQEGTQNAVAMTGPQLSQTQVGLISQYFQEVNIRVSPALEKGVREALRNAGVRAYL